MSTSIFNLPVFNYEAAINGAKFTTRCGNKCRIVTNIGNKILVAISSHNGSVNDESFLYDKSGYRYPGTTHLMDLVMC